MRYRFERSGSGQARSSGGFASGPLPEKSLSHRRLALGAVLVAVLFAAASTATSVFTLLLAAASLRVSRRHAFGQVIEARRRYGEAWLIPFLRPHEVSFLVQRDALAARAKVDRVPGLHIYLRTKGGGPGS